MCLLVEQSVQHRGNDGNVDSNTDVPDTPTQMLCHMQRFLEQKQKSMYEFSINGTLSLRRRDD